MCTAVEAVIGFILAMLRVKNFPGRGLVMALAPPTDRFEAEEAARITFDSRRLHLFDAHGDALASAAGESSFEVGDPMSGSDESSAGLTWKLSAIPYRGTRMPAATRADVKVEGA